VRGGSGEGGSSSSGSASEDEGGAVAAAGPSGRSPGKPPVPPGRPAAGARGKQAAPPRRPRRPRRSSASMLAGGVDGQGATPGPSAPAAAEPDAVAAARDAAGKAAGPSLYQRLRDLVYTSAYIDPSYVLDKLPQGGTGPRGAAGAGSICTAARCCCGLGGFAFEGRGSRLFGRTKAVWESKGVSGHLLHPCGNACHAPGLRMETPQMSCSRSELSCWSGWAVTARPCVCTSTRSGTWQPPRRTATGAPAALLLRARRQLSGAMADITARAAPCRVYDAAMGQGAAAKRPGGGGGGAPTAATGDALAAAMTLGGLSKPGDIYLELVRVSRGTSSALALLLCP
jgi:hypothetical protein